MTSTTTLFQRNKRAYLDEETKLEELLTDTSFQHAFQSWLENTVGSIDAQVETCERQLGELQQQVTVEPGNYWTSKTLSLHCNLYLDESRLVKKGEPIEDTPSWPDLINLVSSLKQLKSHNYITPKQRRFIEQCEQELRHVVFDSEDLLSITKALQTKLREDGNTRSVFMELTKYQNAVDELVPDLDRCEQLLEASIHNGEMPLAEDVSKRQIELFEHVLHLITEQYPVIQDFYTESREGERRRRWAIFRMVNKDITAVVEGKHRQIEACEEDLMKLKQQIENFRNDDVYQRKRYEADRAESDSFLSENKEKQQSVWNRIYELFRQVQEAQTELSSLAHHRRREIDRRLQMEDREAGRRSGHDAFIHAAARHAQRLQDTIDNALAVKDVAIALNNFVLDGCESIASKYDKQQNLLTEALRLVQLHHFKRYSDYTIAASRLLYRKEKQLEEIELTMRENDMRRELLADSLDVQAKQYADANSDLMQKRREAAEEVLMLKHRMSFVDKGIEQTLRSLEFAGVEFVDPRDIAQKMNDARRDEILSYREQISPSLSKNERILKEELEKLTFLVSHHGATTALGEGTGADAGFALAGAKMASVWHKQHLKHIFHLGKPSTPASAIAFSRSSPAEAASTSMELPRVSPDRLAAQTGRGDAVARDINGSLMGLPWPPSAAPTGSPSASPRPPLGNTTQQLTALLDRKLAFQSTVPGGGKATSTNMPKLGNDGSNVSSNRNPLSSSLPSLSPGASGAKPVVSNETAGANTQVLYPTRLEGATFRALYAYRAQAPDELTFAEGDTIICISRGGEEGWFKGVSNQRTGLFPINYVLPAEDG